MSQIYLVGIDGSDPAQRAVACAAAQASKSQAKLILAHIVDWSGYEIMGPAELAERHLHREQEIATAREKITQPATEIAAKHGVTPEVIIHHGHATSLLMNLISEHGVTHVFVGRHGQSRLEALIFGSTANTLAQTAPVPVTVVP